MLTLVYALSIADRFVMSTLIEPIKADLGLSDSSIGFLTGSSLAFFYVTAGLPLATLADRTNRRTMIALALGAWSVMTTLCGFAQNYWQLLLARIGVGVGEAAALRRPLHCCRTTSPRVGEPWRCRYSRWAPHSDR